MYREIKETGFILLIFSLLIFNRVTQSYSEESDDIAFSRDAYVTASLGDARILIPFLADDVSSSDISSFVYNGLTKVDRNLNVVGDLAKDWEVSQNGLEITFNLHDNVFWHDGKPFTAEDVKFTYDVILSPATACPYVSAYTSIKDIEVIDRHKIRFIYKEPYAPALLKLGMGIIPKHLFEGSPDIRKSVYARNPIGTGPYKFVKWVSGQHIILAANDRYFLRVPGIKRYIFRIIPDSSVQFIELVAGSLDSINLSPYQYFYRSDTDVFKERINKYLYLSPSYTYIGYNLNDPVLKDKKVREALDTAINKKEIIDAVLLGLGEPCTGPFRKDTPYYNAGIESRPYDMEKSVKLLKEAGWEDTDGNGIADKNGEELVIKLITNQGNQIREDVATIIERQWSRIGVKTEVQIVAWAAFLDEFIDKKNFQAAMLAWSLPVDPDCYSVWHSDSMASGGLNFVSYSNEKVDRLIEEGRKEFDAEKRKEIYNKIHAEIYNDVPYSFLFAPYATPAVNKRFKGIDPGPAGIGYNFIDWYVPEDEVKYKF